MSLLELAHILQVAVSIFVMHCLLMDTSAYYKSLLERLKRPTKTQLSPRLRRDISDLLQGI